MSSNIKDTIKSLEEKLLLPKVRHSKEDLIKLLSDDFIEFGKSGRIYTKEKVIEALSKEGNEKEIYLYDFEIKELSENTVLALYKTKNNTKVALRSSVWLKHSIYGWQMTFHQGTPQSN